MAAKDSEPKQWTDPKDYGLPFVEILPLRGKPKLAEEEVISAQIVVEETQIESVSPIAPVLDSVTSEPPVEVRKEAEKTEIPVKPRVAKPVVEQEKSSGWVWAVVLIGLGIVAIIVWQILAKNTSAISDTQPQEMEVSAVEKDPEPEEITPESTVTEQNQAAVNQDSINVINNSNPNISKPAETGTTIANVASGNLIRIESKAERPQYFIIVGSLPNEKLAVEESSQYFGKSSEIYLINPEEGGKNYRLALSRFGSFRLAAEELERIKSQYNEELWILKY